MSEKSLEDKFNEWCNDIKTDVSGDLDFDYFVAGYNLAQKDLQQKLDTYIQLAETKGKELEEAVEVIKKCMENTQESDTDNICREYLEKWK